MFSEPWVTVQHTLYHSVLLPKMSLRTRYLECRLNMGITEFQKYKETSVAVFQTGAAIEYKTVIM